MIVQRALGAFLVACVLSAPRIAQAEETKEACVAAHSDSQGLRTQGKLLEAKEKLLLCTRPECPGIARSDCNKWLTEIQDEIPSLIVIAKDPDKNDVTSVRVISDGKVIAEELTAEPIYMDPGKHSLRFEHAGSKALERQLLLRVGERNRRVEIQLVPDDAVAEPVASTPATPDSPERADEGSSIPAATWILGGVGVVGLAGFTYFALDGSSKESDLDACKPNCAHDDVQSAHRSYLIGDISLGVGVAALVGAAYFYFDGRGSKTTGPTALRLQWIPTRHGSQASATLSFF